MTAKAAPGNAAIREGMLQNRECRFEPHALVGKIIDERSR